MDKMIRQSRDGQRDEDKLGVPGGHTNTQSYIYTHSQEACVDIGVFCCRAW